MASVFKIVVTGGPCGGKTSIINRIQEKFGKMGYVVLVVPETATELIPNGVKCFGVDNIGPYLFQEAVVEKQLAKEELYNKIAKQYNVSGKDVIILLDRGIMDGRAFVSEEEFASILNDNELTLSKVMGRYDLVIDMVSTAYDKPECYTTENNSARTEGIEQAKELEIKIQKAWTGHPQFKIVGNCTDFESKIQRVLGIIEQYRGSDKKRLQVQKRYLVEIPTKNILKKLNSTKVEIIQLYLNSNKKGYIRKIRLIDGVCYYSEKSCDSELVREHDECLISNEEFMTLLADVDTTTSVVKKDRYYFLYNENYFQLDLYDKNLCILEVNTNKDNDVNVPSTLHVIADVTEDKHYMGYNLAKVK